LQRRTPLPPEKPPGHIGDVLELDGDAALRLNEARDIERIVDLSQSVQLEAVELRVGQVAFPGAPFERMFEAQKSYRWTRISSKSVQ
jgi:hypothetical protein